jgi:hypothetical protein
MMSHHWLIDWRADTSQLMMPEVCKGYWSVECHSIDDDMSVAEEKE